MASDPIVRLALGRLLFEVAVAMSIARAFGGSSWAGAVVLVAGSAGLAAGYGVSRTKRRRPQRGAHLALIGAALAALSLRFEGAVATGASLAPAALLGSAAIWDLARERADRLKEPLGLSPMTALAVAGGAALGVVVSGIALARVTALLIGIVALGAAITLAATFQGVPGRPVAKPFDAVVLALAGSVALAALR